MRPTFSSRVENPSVRKIFECKICRYETIVSSYLQGPAPIAGIHDTWVYSKNVEQRFDREGESAPVPRNWKLSVAMMAAVGGVAASCLNLAIHYDGWAAVLLPIFAALACKLAHTALSRLKPAPNDPDYRNIQLSLIAGGAISVILASILTRAQGLQLLAGTVTIASVLAALTIGIDIKRRRATLAAAEKVQSQLEEVDRLLELEELVSAQELLEESLLASEMAYGSRHPQVALLVRRLGDVMRRQNRQEAAINMDARVVEIEAARAESSPELVAALSRQADYLTKLKRWAEAQEVAERALRACEHLSDSDRLSGRSSLTLARIQEANGDQNGANETGRTAARLLEKSMGARHHLTLAAKALVARQCIALGRIAEAERLLLEVLREKEKAGETTDSHYLGTLLDLWQVQVREKSSEAAVTLHKTVKAFREEVGPEFDRLEQLRELLPTQLATAEKPNLEALYRALFTGDSTATRRELDADPSLAQTVDSSDWTPLQWACFFDQSEAISMLVFRSADIEYGHRTGMPALIVAARWARRAALSTLFRQENLNLEVEDATSGRAVHAAIRSRDRYIFDQFWSRKVDLKATDRRGWSPLHIAAHVGERKILLDLLSENLDVNMQAGEMRETPLHTAVLGGQVSLTETLLLNLADSSLPDAEGITPKQRAEKRAHIELVNLLKMHEEFQSLEVAPPAPTPTVVEEEALTEPVVETVVP